MVAPDQDFTEVNGAALRRNRPQDVGQILIAEGRGLLQIAEFDLDFDVALFAF